MRPNETIVTDAEREHFSATALRQLQTCAMQYRLQRIDGVTPSHRSASLVLGSVYHGVVATALLSVKDDKDVSKDEMIEWFEGRWKTELAVESPHIKWTKKATADSEHGLGLALVEAWHEQALPVFQKAEEIIAVELRFDVAVFDGYGEPLSRPLVGYIDVVYRTVDGKVVVVDHKTAAQAFGDSVIESDLQPSVYVHAVRSLGIADDPVFHFHSMSKTKKPKLSIVEVPRGDDDIDRLDWICGQAERLIATGVFLPSAPDWKCEGCEYSHACRRAHAEIVGPADEAVSQPSPAVAPPPVVESVSAE